MEESKKKRAAASENAGEEAKIASKPGASKKHGASARNGASKKSTSSKKSGDPAASGAASDGGANEILENKTTFNF